MTTNTPSGDPVPQLFKANLEKIGITLTIEVSRSGDVHQHLLRRYPGRGAAELPELGLVAGL